MDGDEHDGEYDWYDGFGDDGYEVDDRQPARRGARFVAVLIGFLLIAGAAAAILQADDDDPDHDEVATEEEDEDTTTTSRRSTTTTRPRSTTSTTATGTGPAPGVAGGSSTTIAGKTTATTKAPATTTTTEAPEVLEPACASGGGGPAAPAEADWAEHWQSKPFPNDPARVSICVDDTSPKVGQTITITLQGSDPDAVIEKAECGWFITWESDHSSLCRDFLAPDDGPRPTPVEQAGFVRITETHVYQSPGSRTVTGSVWSAPYHGYTEPYSSRATADLRIVVHG